MYSHLCCCQCGSWAGHKMYICVRHHVGYDRVQLFSEWKPDRDRPIQKIQFTTLNPPCPTKTPDLPSAPVPRQGRQRRKLSRPPGRPAVEKPRRCLPPPLQFRWMRLRGSRGPPALQALLLSFPSLSPSPPRLRRTPGPLTSFPRPPTLGSMHQPAATLDRATLHPPTAR